MPDAGVRNYRCPGRSAPGRGLTGIIEVSTAGGGGGDDPGTATCDTPAGGTGVRAAVEPSGGAKTWPRPETALGGGSAAAAAGDTTAADDLSGTALPGAAIPARGPPGGWTTPFVSILRSRLRMTTSITPCLVVMT